MAQRDHSIMSADEILNAVSAMATQKLSTNYESFINYVIACFCKCLKITKDQHSIIKIRIVHFLEYGIFLAEKFLIKTISLLEAQCNTPLYYICK